MLGKTAKALLLSLVCGLCAPALANSTETTVTENPDGAQEPAAAQPAVYQDGVVVPLPRTP